MSIGIFQFWFLQGKDLIKTNSDHANLIMFYAVKKFVAENEKDWWRIDFTFHFPLKIFSWLEKRSNLYDLDCFWLYLSVAKVRIEKFLLTKKLWPKNCDWVPHWLCLELVVFYCNTSMPLRAMRIPQRAFGLMWGKNITRALSKKTRFIILRQKLRKL